MAFVNFSYKIIDASSGEILKTATLKKKRKVKDDYSEAVDLANIPFDPIQLPTDTELLEMVSTEIANELGDLVLAPLRDRAETYYREGIREDQRRNHETAVERCTDAIFLEKLRGHPTEKTEEAKECIAKILRET